MVLYPRERRTWQLHTMRHAPYHAGTELRGHLVRIDVQRDWLFGGLGDREADKHAKPTEVDKCALGDSVQANSERTKTYTFRPTTVARPRPLGRVQAHHSVVVSD